MPVDFDLGGKVIALTGAASGIGFETARLLASQGAHLSICDVNAEALASKKEEILSASTSGKVFSMVVDVREPEQVNDWISGTVEELGRLDGGVNLAGVIPKVINIERVEDLNDEDWKFVIDVNLHGVMFVHCWNDNHLVHLLTRALLTLRHCMRAQLRNMNEKGSIVNAASICGLIGFPKNAAYTVAKHGVIGLTRTAAKEVGDRAIRCNAIAPQVSIVEHAMPS